MQLTTLVIALLASVSEAKRGHHYRLMAADPPSGATCYRGNQKQYPVSGDNTPPCWYAEPDSSYSCYEIDPKTSQCPNFPNKVNKPGNGNNSATCFRGNQKQYPVSGKNTPPCWYKEADGSNSCYEYEPSTGKCPNFPNPISKPSYHLRASSHKGHSRYLHGAQKLQKAGGRHKSHLLAHKHKGADEQTCLRGNQVGIEVLLVDAPPCIYDEGSHLSCYEYYEGTHTCPPNPSRIPHKNYKLKAHHKEQWCIPGNQRNQRKIYDPEHQKCWKKESDGEYSCYDKVDGQCPKIIFPNGY